LKDVLNWRLEPRPHADALSCGSDTTGSAASAAATVASPIFAGRLIVIFFRALVKITIGPIRPIRPLTAVR
jgi:hypothetical protein